MAIEFRKTKRGNLTVLNILFSQSPFFGCKIKPTFIIIIILIRFTFLINQFFVDHIYIKLFLYYIEDKNECIYQGN